MKGTVKVIKFYPERCKGHFECERACSKVQHGVKERGEKSAIRITKAKSGKWECTVCNHCGLCIDLCPVLALRRLSGGTVVVNKNLCVGCQACVAFCPRGVMRRAPGKIIPHKCVSCGQCVKACPEKALELVEMNIEDLQEEVYARHGKVCP